MVCLFLYIGPGTGFMACFSSRVGLVLFKSLISRFVRHLVYSGCIFVVKSFIANELFIPAGTSMFYEFPQGSIGVFGVIVVSLVEIEEKNLIVCVFVSFFGAFFLRWCVCVKNCYTHTQIRP